MKIAYIISEVYSMGGAPKVTIDKINHLVNRGHELYLITERQFGKPSYYGIDEKVKHFDLAFDCNTVNQISNPLKRIIAKKAYRANYKKNLEELLFQINVDICVQVYFTLDADILTSIKDNSKKVLESHGIKYALLPQIRREGFKKLLFTPFEKWQRYRYERIPLNYDHFVCLTKDYIDEWPKVAHKSYIYNFVDFTNENMADLESKNVVFLGRLSEEKNVSELLDIWKIVGLKDSKWTLKIIGDGPQLRSLQEQCQMLSICNSVEFIPATQNVKAVYSNTSIIVLSSLQEGFPMSLIEAHRFGIPTISYDCSSGPRAIIEDGVNGFLIPMHNKELYAEKLRLLMEDSNRLQEMGKKAKEASRRFDIEIIMPQWEALFNKLIK